MKHVFPLILLFSFVSSIYPQKQSSQEVLEQNITESESIPSCNNTLPAEQEAILNQYDREICDEVTPPKVSATMAWLRNIGGFILLKGIAIKESILLKSIAIKEYIRFRLREYKQKLRTYLDCCG